MVRFGSKWYADKVFADRTARPLSDIFDERYIRKTLGIAAHRGVDFPQEPISGE